MPRPKRLERLRIWLSGAASWAGALRAVRETPSAGGVGRHNFSFSESGHPDFGDEWSCSELVDT